MRIVKSIGPDSLYQRLVVDRVARAGAYIRDASISPDRAVAGKYTTFTLTFTAGGKRITRGMVLAIDFPGILETTRPQIYFQEDPGYTTFDFGGRADCSIDLCSYERGTCKDNHHDDSVSERRIARVMLLGFRKSTLATGDHFRIRFGDNSDGMGPGAMMGIVVPYPGYKYWFHYKLFRNGNLRQAVDSGRFHVAVHPDRPVRCISIPRHSGNRQEVAYQIEDQYRNVSFSRRNDHGVTIHGPARINRYGILTAAAGTRVSFASTGIRVTRAPQTRNIFQGNNAYFGDTHVHTAYSIDVKMRHGHTLDPAGMLDFARHSALLDFCMITDHHEPHNPTLHQLSESEWRSTMAAADQADSPGRFVAIPGIEYRCARGDTVVLFGEKVSRRDMARADKPGITELWEKFAGRRIITIPHFHGPGSLGPDEWLYNEEFDRLVEVHSDHGNYFADKVEHRVPPGCKRRRPDRNATWLLQQGFRYGCIASGDDHKGHCGRPALCGVLARELTRESIFDALYNRHTFGTSGDRIVLCLSGNRRLMGSTIPAGRVAFAIAVRGTDRIRSVEFLRNGRPCRVFAPGRKNFRATITESAKPGSYYQVTVVQENTHLAWSSPIWIE